MAKGISSTPPKLTRVSPGVYRDASGKITKSGGGKAPAATGGKKPVVKAATNASLLTQRTQGDAALGQAANAMTDQINQNYSQPFDFQKYNDMAPVQGDYQNWVNTQMGNYNNAYDQRMNPVNAQQSQDFEQEMANRGIPMGSTLYNQQKELMMQGQNDARTQAYASGQGQAIQGAQGLFNVGSQAQQNAYNMGQAQRNQPLTDYSNLYGAQSTYAQQEGLQNNQAQNALMVAKNSPRGGGGGGGGSGLGGYNGTGLSFQDYMNAQNQSKLALQQGLNALNPQPQTPNPYASMGGSILGNVAGGLMQGWAASGFQT